MVGPQPTVIGFEDGHQQVNINQVLNIHTPTHPPQVNIFVYVLYWVLNIY